MNINIDEWVIGSEVAENAASDLARIAARLTHRAEGVKQNGREHSKTGPLNVARLELALFDQAYNSLRSSIAEDVEAAKKYLLRAEAELDRAEAEAK